MKQAIEIEVPEGKKAVWKDNKVIFENIELPKTWEEYCDANPLRPKEYFIGVNSGIIPLNTSIQVKRNPNFEKNLLTSEKDAKSHLALMQLHRLRDCYRQEWKPIDNKVFFGIARILNGSLYIDRYMSSNRFLSFQSAEIAEDFLNNFRDLIEEAGDLI